MVEIKLSPLAKADINEIADYIGHKLSNPPAALRMVRRFHEAILPLSTYPEMGTPLAAAGKHEIIYRYLVCGSYMIFYHIDDSVKIDRILYGRRDYMALLFGNELEEEE